MSQRPNSRRISIGVSPRSNTQYRNKWLTVWEEASLGTGLHSGSVAPLLPQIKSNGGGYKPEASAGYTALRPNHINTLSCRLSCVKIGAWNLNGSHKRQGRLNIPQVAFPFLWDQHSYLDCTPPPNLSHRQSKLRCQQRHFSTLVARAYM